MRPMFRAVLRSGTDPDEICKKRRTEPGALKTYLEVQPETALISRNSSSPYLPPSRPFPDCL